MHECVGHARPAGRAGGRPRRRRASSPLLVTKTVTPLPRDGNAAPRVGRGRRAGCSTRSAWPTRASTRFAAGAAGGAALGRPLVVSVGGFSHADYGLASRRLDGEAGVAALELNVSCPNVKSGCISIGTDPGETGRSSRCRAATRPLWVKLSPNVADLAAIARAAEGGGADALVLTNTLRGLALDRGDARAAARRSTGGLSGPALRPVALAAVRPAARPCALPIVGVGGIASGGDAREFLAAGARAVAGRQRSLPRAALARRGAERSCDPTRGARPRVPSRPRKQQHSTRGSRFSRSERIFCASTAWPAL